MQKEPSLSSKTIKEWSYSLRDHLKDLKKPVPLQTCLESLSRTVTKLTWNDLLAAEGSEDKENLSSAPTPKLPAIDRGDEPFAFYDWLSDYHKKKVVPVLDSIAEMLDCHPPSQDPFEYHGDGLDDYWTCEAIFIPKIFKDDWTVSPSFAFKPRFCFSDITGGISLSRAIEISIPFTEDFRHVALELLGSKYLGIHTDAKIVKIDCSGNEPCYIVKIKPFAGGFGSTCPKEGISKRDRRVMIKTLKKYGFPDFVIDFRP